MKNYKDKKISSPFGLRKNPTAPGNHFHRGIDIISKHIYAGYHASVNTVSFGKQEGNFAQFFLMIEGVPFYINIFHMKKKPVHLIPGNIVESNHIIGEMGETGNTTGPHIHYEIFSYRLQDNFINNLKNNVEYYIENRRIFFDPIPLYDLLKSMGYDV